MVKVILKNAVLLELESAATQEKEPSRKRGGISKAKLVTACENEKARENTKMFFEKEAIEVRKIHSGP